jgi:CheY-like chemotaxis protein
LSHRDQAASVPWMVGVLTVDDQAVFRAAARDVIDATPGFEPAAEATSGPEALELVSEVRPRLAFVDVRMPGMDGMETARLLREADPALVVVLISLEDAANLPPPTSACGGAGAQAGLLPRSPAPAMGSARWPAGRSLNHPRRVTPRHSQRRDGFPNERSDA